ncbi:MAG: translesion error-prone DNA polymerase V autoproteolytic subunit [Pseudomonadota bacterium]
MPPHGGRRPGAGRKPGAEPSKTLRVPASRVEAVRAFLRTPPDAAPVEPRFRSWGMVEYLGEPTRESPLALPLFAARVPAGFPSPAEDYAQGRLDLNDYLVEHEAATFYVRVKGQSMVGAGILDGDVIAVDRALEPRHGDIVLAVIDGELTVKELHREGGVVRLLPRNPDFPPIEPRPGQELTIWGVVKGVVRKLR